MCNYLYNFLRIIILCTVLQRRQLCKVLLLLLTLSFHCDVKLPPMSVEQLKCSSRDDTDESCDKFLMLLSLFIAGEI